MSLRKCSRCHRDTSDDVCLPCRAQIDQGQDPGLVSAPDAALTAGLDGTPSDLQEAIGAVGRPPVRIPPPPRVPRLPAEEDRDTEQSQLSPQPGLIPGDVLRGMLSGIESALAGINAGQVTIVNRLKSVEQRMERLESVSNGARLAALHIQEAVNEYSDRLSTLVQRVQGLRCQLPPECGARPTLREIAGGGE